MAQPSACAPHADRIVCVRSTLTFSTCTVSSSLSPYRTVGAEGSTVTLTSLAADVEAEVPTVCGRVPSTKLVPGTGLAVLVARALETGVPPHPDRSDTTPRAAAACDQGRSKARHPASVRQGSGLYGSGAATARRQPGGSAASGRAAVTG